MLRKRPRELAHRDEANVAAQVSWNPLNPGCENALFDIVICIDNIHKQYPTATEQVPFTKVFGFVGEIITSKVQ